jgi:hypothetical protein
MLLLIKSYFFENFSLKGKFTKISKFLDTDFKILSVLVCRVLP